MRDNFVYERFKSLLQENQVIRQDKAAVSLGLTEGQLFERLMAWYASGEVEYRIIDDLIIMKNMLIEHDITYKGKTIHYDEKEDLVTFDTEESSLKSLHKNNVRDLIENSETIGKNTFVGDKFEHYYENAVNEIEHINSFAEESKKAPSIPKISRKDQIYWLCETCGQSNPYFLSFCKDCRGERPDSLYKRPKRLDREISVMRNGRVAKFLVSEIVTDHWQTVDVIANRLGIKNVKDKNLLRLKLRFLERSKLITPNSNGKMFKLSEK